MADLATVMSVTVVICAYTLARWHDLTTAVAALIAQRARLGSDGSGFGPGANVELLLVVDHNEELHQRAVAELPHVRVLASSATPGLSGARNHGVAAARGDIVLFLDDDACPDPDWLRQHLNAFLDPAVIGTAGHVEPNWDGGRAPSWWPNSFNWVVGCSYDHRAAGTAVRNPIGANMGFRRAAILEADGFREGLGRRGDNAMGCEETELAIKIGALHPDRKIVSVPGAVCHHRVPQERSTWSYFWRRCQAEGRSKAIVAQNVGASSATQVERGYAVRTARRAVANLGRPGRMRQGLAMLGGLSAAGFAFLRHRAGLAEPAAASPTGTAPATA